MVSSDSSYVTVTTGAIRFRLSKSAGTLFDTVWLGSPYGDGQKIVSTPADVVIVRNSDGASFKAQYETAPTLTVEESGPVRAVVKAAGKLRLSAGGTNYVDYVARYYAYVGLSTVEVEYSIVDSATTTNAAYEPNLTTPENASQYQFYAKSLDFLIPHTLSSPSYAFGGSGSNIHAGTV